MRATLNKLPIKSLSINRIVSMFISRLFLLLNSIYIFRWEYSSRCRHTFPPLSLWAATISILTRPKVASWKFVFVAVRAVWPVVDFQENGGVLESICCHRRVIVDSLIEILLHRRSPHRLAVFQALF